MSFWADYFRIRHNTNININTFTKITLFLAAYFRTWHSIHIKIHSQIHHFKRPISTSDITLLYKYIFKNISFWAACLWTRYSIQIYIHLLKNTSSSPLLQVRFKYSVTLPLSLCHSSKLSKKDRASYRYILFIYEKI